ncbi:40S ribosomal protein S27-like [Dionaea muscipula]
MGNRFGRGLRSFPRSLPLAAQNFLGTLLKLYNTVAEFAKEEWALIEPLVVKWAEEPTMCPVPKRNLFPFPTPPPHAEAVRLVFILPFGISLPITDRACRIPPLFYPGFAIMVLQNDIDLLNPPAELEKKKHKLKRLVQSPNSFFMDVKCQGCFNITTVFSHSQTVVVCGNCQTVLCQPTGGRARLTEGCSFRKKGD